MGWYLRKSVRMGPVRWNLSKSGIGMSVGVRGLRVGTGPRGAYIAGGRSGLYFRQQLGSSRGGAHPPQRPTFPSPGMPGYTMPPSPTPISTPAASAPVEYLPETDVTQYTPATADALAHYIVAQRQHVAWFWWAVGVLILINLAILGVFWPLIIVVAPLSAYVGYYLYHLDRQRTHVMLHYDLDAHEHQNFGQLCSALAALGATARLQRVEARQVHGDWKHQAGTTTSLKLGPVSVLAPGYVRWLETNVPIWSIQWRQGGITLSFLPDRVLIQQRRAVAVLPYTEVHVIATLGRFVEGGAPPPDARILGYNWQYPNKDGGPDRRFKYNRQLPVTEASYIGLQSASGLNLAIQSSNRQHAEGFISGLRSYRPLVCAAPAV
jgi:uncharacterized protein DUF4236